MVVLANLNDVLLGLVVVLAVVVSVSDILKKVLAAMVVVLLSASELDVPPKLLGLVVVGVLQQTVARTGQTIKSQTKVVVRIKTVGRRFQGKNILHCIIHFKNLKECHRDET